MKRIKEVTVIIYGGLGSARFVRYFESTET